jgi:hypothetical protein
MSTPATEVRARPVVYTEEQHREIRDLMRAGKVLEAQRLILSILNENAAKEEQA